MKRNSLIFSALVLCFVFTLFLLNKVSLAQDTTGDDQNVTQTNNENNQEDLDQSILWDTSLPVPVGVQVQSPPDDLNRIDPLDTEDRASYNASLRIAGSILRPREMHTGLEWMPGGEGGCLYASAGYTNICFNTPLYLPQDSTIRYFRFYYNDTNATYNSSAFLTVYDLYGDIFVEFALYSSGDVGKGYTTTAELDLVVDYDYYSYVINWRPSDLGSDMQLCGFRIFYQAPPGSTYLPLINNGG